MPPPPATVAWSRPAARPPAFNTVNPRTTLRPESTLSGTPSAAPKGKKVEWPPAVREYVRRAFDKSNAIKGISNEEMQEKLKETIGYYAERKAHCEVDWSTYPLPQELLDEERKKAAPASVHGTSANASSNAFSTANMPSKDGQANPYTPTSKKRKSQEPDDTPSKPSQPPSAPWNNARLESRMTFPQGHGDKRHKTNVLDNTSKSNQIDLEKRRQRFNLGAHIRSSPPRGYRDEYEQPTGPVVGTNQDLEKRYYRLTAPPKAETVRPLHILVKTLDMLTKKWEAEKNYNYICNQLKSLRQDLTVQHIKNDFTVKVYEKHARISLEKGDLGEYNQCQTQLKGLYAQKLAGNPAEFTAYRILYFVYTCNKTDMNDVLAELTAADKAQEWIKHALDVRSALALGNYHRFFRLYHAAPNMGSYLMDMFIERERLCGLANISKGYLSVALRFLTDELGFENDETCREFLEAHGGQNLVEHKEDGQARVRIREGAASFERLRAAAFRTVDIKGQI